MTAHGFHWWLDSSFPSLRSLCSFAAIPTALFRMNLGLNRRLNRRLNGYTTTLAPGARRPNGMTEVSNAFREYFRWRKRFAKLMPDFFDYAGAERRAREESERRQLEIELNAALDKVYGPLSMSDQLLTTR